MAELTSDRPLVSIVVVLQDGASPRTLESLAGVTDYRPLELVVIDNGMRRDSIPDLSAWPDARPVIVNDIRTRVGAATNQAIRAANGEVVLLAHDDLEVADRHWLDDLVAGLTDDVAAIGPDAGAVHFEPGPYGARGVTSAVASTAAASPGIREVPAIGGCILARRGDLLQNLLGDFPPLAAEWDLCFRLAAIGRIVVDDRVRVRHLGNGFREIVPDDAQPARRHRDTRAFNQLWGPGLLRRLREEVDRGEGGRFYRAPGPPVLRLVPGASATAERFSAVLTEEAAAAGWETTTGKPPACDLAVALRPLKDVQWLAGQGLSVAAVTDNLRDWARSGALDAARVVLVPDDIAAARLHVLWGEGNITVEPRLQDPGPGLLDALLDAARPRPDAMRIGVSTCAPDWPTARFWGDTHLARGLMRAFRRCGHDAVELTVDDWQGQGAAACDVVVHLRGLNRRPVAPGQWNVLWVISHPDRLEPGECDDYDLVASASKDHAEQLTRQLGRPVHYLPQAADSDVFRLGPRSPEYEGAVLYVGNARWPARRAPRWLTRLGREFDLYGKNWEKFPEGRHVRGEYIDNRELPTAYRSAAVVVADHHGSMRANGLVANRLFDVLASGGLVLSDTVAGLTELFGDVVPTYADAEELDARLEELLADPALRRRLVTEGRKVVLASHTLDHRARRILELLDEL